MRQTTCASCLGLQKPFYIWKPPTDSAKRTSGRSSKKPTSSTMPLESTVPVCKPASILVWLRLQRWKQAHGDCRAHLYL
jgi:hypothetical protein